MAEAERSLDTIDDLSEALRLVITDRGIGSQSSVRERDQRMQLGVRRNVRMFQNAVTDHITYICQEIAVLQPLMTAKCRELARAHGVSLPKASWRVPPREGPGTACLVLPLVLRQCHGKPPSTWSSARSTPPPFTRLPADRRGHPGQRAGPPRPCGGRAVRKHLRADCTVRPRAAPDQPPSIPHGGLAIKLLLDDSVVVRGRAGQDFHHQIWCALRFSLESRWFVAVQHHDQIGLHDVPVGQLQIDWCVHHLTQPPLLDLRVQLKLNARDRRWWYMSALDSQCVLR